MQNRYVRLFVGILIVAAAAIWTALPGNPGIHINFVGIQINHDFPIVEGLDLQGGMQVLLQADAPPGIIVTADNMNVAKGIIERRVNALGANEPLIQITEGNRIIVELPGIKDKDAAIRTFGQTGLLEFVDAGSTYLPPGTVITTSLGGASPQSATAATPGATAQAGSTAVATASVAPPSPTVAPTAPPTLAPTAAGGGTPGPTTTGAATQATPAPTAQPSPPVVPQDPTKATFATIMQGKDVQSADVGFDQYGRPDIKFTLTGPGAKVFGDYTTANVGKYLAITMDKTVISCPIVNSPITAGSGVIDGGQTGFPLAEAQSIVVQLRYGSLPIPLKVVQIQDVGPTLGEDSLRRSLIAGAIGLAIVATFMLAYYRIPGLLADLALLVYTAVVFSTFKVIPVTLTLAGIAGFILSIGMAVDANILIFERMKEEIRAGRTLRAAIDAGFARAWTSIRDSNVSTMITCVILFWFGASFGASIIQGFALTLGIGVLVSLFTAILVSRTFLHLFIDTGLVKDLRWYGLEKSEG